MRIRPPSACEGEAAEPSAADAAAAGGGGGFVGAVVPPDVPEEVADDVALLAIANTVDAIDGLSPPPPSREPLETVLAAAASAPGLDGGTSVLAPPLVPLGCSDFGSLSASVRSGLHLSCIAWA